MSIGSSLKDALWMGDYPPSAFNFKVILGCSLGLTDTSFQEVSGIEASVSVEDQNEGGFNTVNYTLGQVKHPNLVLKRGLAPITSPLVMWCQSVFDLDYRVQTISMPLIVMLMNGDRDPLRVWMFNNALPVAWKIDAFNSTKNEVALETIELKYSGLTRIV
ncbi:MULTISPECIES: phage tail protein [unclassified Agarivorans]|uniref:phage tail protein n=1 Tax=unclassified Agarivorans TaxID=2636026 RepID=UPI0026E42B5E|nr:MULTISPECIES: phage tail protein [unclassified Agarivorans]MDO6686766.1 phage tail protein [Agarivorans sp. 3_MG-2023]MDO6716504.1 phage tail protein [Agarivorans sp. 2_MG-2023]